MLHRKAIVPGCHCINETELVRIRRSVTQYRSSSHLQRPDNMDRHLAHLKPFPITDMVISRVVRGINLRNTAITKLNSTVCMLGKVFRTPIPNTSSKTTRLLKLVHSHVNGPSEVPYLRISRYFVIFTDDYSRLTNFYTMKQKSEPFEFSDGTIHSLKDIVELI